MTIQQSVLAALTAILPIIGVMLPGIFKSDGLSKEVNSLIAFALIVLISGIQAWCAGQIGINPFLDFPVVMAGISALMAGPFKPLDQWLQGHIKLVMTPPAKAAPPASDQPGEVHE